MKHNGIGFSPPPIHERMAKQNGVTEVTPQASKTERFRRFKLNTVLQRPR